MSSKIQRQARLTLLAAMLASLGAQARAAEPLLSASSSLSGLNFQLIDLNPSDGIAPSLTLLKDGQWFTSTLQSDGLNAFGGEELVTTVPLMGSTSASPLPVFTQGDGRTSFYATATSVGTTAQMSASDLKTVSDTSTFVYDQGATIQTSTTVSTNTSGGNYSRFELRASEETWNPDIEWWSSTFSGRLSPNTALIITGQANLNLRADNSSLVESINNALASNENAYISSGGYGSTSGQINLSLSINTGSSDATSSASNTSGSYFDMGDSVFFNADGLTRSYPFSGVSESIDGSLAELNTSKNFSLVAFNNSDNTSDLAFGMYLGSGVDQVLTTAVSTVVFTENPNWVPDSPTPVIPEPSTYALMGLGLVGLSLVARRQPPRNT